MHQMVDVSEFDNENRPDGWMFELFIDAQPQ